MSTDETSPREDKPSVTKADRQTLDAELMTRIKNNRIVAALIVAGSIAIVVLTFADQISDLWAKLWPQAGHHATVTEPPGRRNAATAGDNSPAISGDGNTVTYGDSTKPNSQPKKGN